ncbi:MAG: flippase [candidate division KSB1 bacterium]|nr:flippase [candidate division KSB1 bacterium]MDZ7275970.1 flippase [candidate division KSB1 bacterium]MDZ7285748.1 flippase [candidate division KSB1 bacterium]MDZ7298780.1 flippase [candidate division KSB1 bacterium]MDZ7307930.1 flippase [candidate division KSB1 bacterium]
MSTLQRFFRNTSVLLLANALQPVLSFYLVVTISRRLQVEGLGAYATVFNYQAIFQIISAFGLKNLLTRNVAQQKELAWHHLWHASLAVVPFSLLSMLLLILLTAALQYGAPVLWATVIVSLSLLAAAWAEVCEGVLAGLERLHVVGYSAVVENALRVILSLFALAQGFGLLALVWVFVACRFGRALFYFTHLHRLLAATQPSGRFHFDRAFALRLVSQARVFALTMVCVTVYWKLDVSLLSKLRDMEEVGLYSAAYRFLMLALVVVDSFVNSLFPIISNYYRAGRTAGEGGGSFEVACKKGLQLLLVLTVPVALALSLLADPIIDLIYGEQFAAAAAVLRVLIWVVVPYAASQIFAYALVASNNQRYDLWVNALSMLANLALNGLLIRRFGYMGATWAAVAAIVVYVVLQVPFVFRQVIHFESRPLWQGGLKLVAAAACMAGTLLLFAKMQIWFLMPLAFFIYLLAVWVVGVFSKQDWALATRFLK